MGGIFQIARLEPCVRRLSICSTLRVSVQQMLEKLCVSATSVHLAASYSAGNLQSQIASWFVVFLASKVPRLWDARHDTMSCCVPSLASTSLA